jgi:asparagine synthase (glutamine-hydrolysing)
MRQINTGTPDKECTIGFASELKMLSGFDAVGIPNSKYSITHFKPGTYSKYEFSDKVCSEWRASQQNVVYHRMAFSNTYKYENLEEILRGVRHYLTAAVEKRCSTTERPIACLLSGGLDSSLIAALVNDYHQRCGLPTLETYSIGLADSTDLKYAKIVADHLGTKHTEVVLTESEFCEAIPEVIAAIESYDTTTVRASIGNYLLGKYIAAHSEAKVIFNGDGSDELLGGYLYMGMAPDAIEFDRECRRLLTDIHAFDVLRSDKSISSHGLEPRTPFLDREWTQFVLSINPAIRRDRGEPEKYLLRRAFDKVALLPAEVLWRKKEAFSDGVSGHERSLYQILQESCVTKVPLSYRSYAEMAIKSWGSKTNQINLPETAEQYLYRAAFESCYPGMGEVVPYFWMPKYVDAKDASARTLEVYGTHSPKKLPSSVSLENDICIFAKY